MLRCWMLGVSVRAGESTERDKAQTLGGSRRRMPPPQRRAPGLRRHRRRRQLRLLAVLTPQPPNAHWLKETDACAQQASHSIARPCALIQAWHLQPYCDSVM
jgi:hypothetical protein